MSNEKYSHRAVPDEVEDPLQERQRLDSAQQGVPCPGM